MVSELPKFKGYTVDERLKEFRKAEYGKSIEFIPFVSPKGQELLEEKRANVQDGYVEKVFIFVRGGIVVSVKDAKGQELSSDEYEIVDYDDMEEAPET